MIAAVIDCSAMVDMLWRGGASAFFENEHLHSTLLAAPHLIDPELVSAARRIAARQDDGFETAFQLIVEYSHVPVTLFEHANLRDFAWQVRDTISSYDAMYVALARDLRIPLITSDGRLAQAASNWCEVTVLDELLQG